LPGAEGPAGLWELLIREVDPIEEVPPDRFDIDAYYDPRPGTPGKIVTREGGFLDDIRRFDAPFFGISGREAAGMDPQQRILLEVVWETLEDAGIRPDDLEASRTGVFVGMIANEYRHRAIREGAQMDVYSESGTTRAGVAGRVSHTFGWNGPSLTVDTACSSSLVATHLACESIRSGSSEAALVGGTNLILEPESSIAFSRTGMLAADGRCKFGDARADGFVRSDGVGAVLLKPLSRALADDDAIRAVIWETGSNNDGRSGEGLFMTPSREGQRELLRGTYEGREPLVERMDYVEAHGTGTAAGDPTEIGALSDVLAGDRDEPLKVGSVKSNIGHSEGAAGIAGLIEAILVLEHRYVPRSLHVEEPNPEIPWESLDLEVVDEGEPLERDRPLLAGVNSFGITGTNAHVALEEWRGPEQYTGTRADSSPVCLPISARTSEGLTRQAEQYAEVLEEHGADEEDGGDMSVDAVCDTAATGRSHRRHRLAVVGEDCGELAGELEDCLERRRDSAAPTELLERDRTAFVFSGQGGQFAEMGEYLLGEPEVADVVACLDEVVGDLAGWSVREVLREPDRWQGRVSRVQPLLFATQVALAEMWRRRGVEPDVVVGHSLGEVAAAHVAGASSLEEAARVICERSRLLERIAGEGAMAVVRLGPAEAREFVASYGDRVTVAVESTPEASVVSGAPAALGELEEQLERRDVRFEWVDVDVASHSAQVEPLLAPLGEALEGLEGDVCEIPMYSTARDGFVTGPELGPEYWRENLRRPVQFVSAVRRLADCGIDTFVELSPHPVAAQPIRQMLRDDETPRVVVPSMRREQPPSERLAGSIAELYEAGYEVDWDAIYADGPPVELPRYPFDGERYWFESGGTEPASPTVHRVDREEFEETRERHPLLGRTFELGARHDITVWEASVTPEELWYLDEHRVRGSVVFPAAGYAEMAVAVAGELFDDGWAIESLSLDDILVVPDEAKRRLQAIAEATGEGRYELEFVSFDPEKGKGVSDGPVHARAELVGVEASGLREPPVVNGGELTGAEAVYETDAFYAAMEDRGIDDGPAFRCVDELRRSGRRVEGQLEIPESIRSEVGNYVVHPAVLDGVLQVVAPFLMDDEAGEGDEPLFLPDTIGRLAVHGEPTPRMRAVAAERENDVAGRVRIDVRISDELGNPVLDLHDFEVCEVRRQVDEAHPMEEWFYGWSWERAGEAGGAAVVGDERPKQGGWVVLSHRGGFGDDLSGEFEDRDVSSVVVHPGEETELDGTPYRLDVESAGAGDVARLLAVAEGTMDGVDGIAILWPAEEATSVDRESLRPARTVEMLRLGARLAEGIEQAELEAPPRVRCVTAGAREVGGSTAGPAVEQAPVWAFARVLRKEMARIDARCIDLVPGDEREGLGLLAGELLADDAETEVAIRDGARHVHRLEHLPAAGEESERRKLRRWVGADEQFRLQRAEPSGIDGLRLAPGVRVEPGAGDIEIDIRTTGLNFADVIAAMGLTGEGDKAIGYECVGVVERVGEEVDRLESGMRVMAFAPSANCFGGYATMTADLAVAVPGELEWRRAATIPSVYLTAYYALIREGNLQNDESVLIHSASGGVGHAALQIAREVGADIFATAGTDQKREYLRREFGLEAVMDSRSLEFADEIEERTAGGGVDVVLNTLTGEGTRRGLEILRPLGRFLDLSQSEMHGEQALGLEPFEKNLSYVGIDITQVAAHRPGLVGAMWEEIRQKLESGVYRPIPVDSAFQISNVREAFEYMRRGEHIGKIVVEQDVDSMVVAPPVEPETIFLEEASYLLTGGTGGLGLEVADWMSRRGAGHLVLVSRSGADERAERQIARMRRRGTRVTVAHGDVTDRERLREIVDEARKGAEKLRGVFHLAAVLEDATIANQTTESLQRAFGPKALGAWHLHELTDEDALDYFVMFSSGVAVLGAPGQMNYAAASEFVDALAVRRRRAGLPGTSIGWGRWREVGLAAASEHRGGRLGERGLEGMDPEEGIEALERILLREGPAHVAVSAIDWQAWAEAFPRVRRNALYAPLVGGDGESDGAAEPGRIADEITESDGRERDTLVADYLRREVSRVLGTSAAKLDFGKSAARMGLDSLMVVELRVRLEERLGVDLSGETILEAPDLDYLTDQVVDELERT
jgi:acyl transferase domain-containing protein/NADPH:quinone reductase-like Zn-dependent oxidoreductase/acyl carrier protein